ncbi:MAG: hypothetical protein M5U17_14705 [Ignavibacterium sp.]|nr:hypothetical protein [Ignavibacterium sp.]
MNRSSLEELKRKERASSRILFALVVLAIIIISTLIFILAQDI